jgi:nitrogen fixation/metabolism regulation signal transduction histidine kinase
MRTRTEPAILNVRRLALIYALLCVLSILFAGVFFTRTFEDGSIPDIPQIIAFLTIPVILLAFLAASLIRLFRDFITRKTGGRFEARLAVYFIVIVVLAAAPVTIITTQAVSEILRFWHSMHTGSALNSGLDMALDTYSLRLEHLEALIREGGAGNGAALPETLPGDFAAVQDFVLNDAGIWASAGFSGDLRHLLEAPPGAASEASAARQDGFVARHMPRDTDVIRFLQYQPDGRIRVITCRLGEGFDAAVITIEQEKARFELLDNLSLNVRATLIVYYGVFFLPTLLMTLIIAISFTRRIAQPIAALTDAMRRVAGGDFAVHILGRPNDELGLLIGSFNSMVQNLEKSRLSLVNAEKISVWQSMAQQLAHEIKNPLTPIKLSAERVLRRYRTAPDRLEEIVEESMLAIIQEVEGLSTLLTEFRTLSRPIEPTRAWTGIAEIVEEVVAPYRVSYPALCFNTDHIDATASAQIERRHLVQVLTNLVINGIDAMDGRGAAAEAEAGIEIRCDMVTKRDHRFCRLCVRDSGKGIAAAEYAHVFTPYYTTKQSGTGLGLPIVERIVTGSGGTIWFDSTPGVGTTFFVDLPAQ